MRMENDLIARKLNLLTVFFPALAPSYKEIILNSFDQYSLLKAYVRRIMDNYPGIQAEDHEKLEKALTQSLRDSEVDCIHKYLSAKFSDEAIEALVKEMEGRHDEPWHTGRRSRETGKGPYTISAGFGSGLYP